MEEIMADFNKVILAGHLTKIPDVRTLQNNITVASSGIAVNRKYKDKEEVLYIETEDKKIFFNTEKEEVVREVYERLKKD